MRRRARALAMLVTLAGVLLATTARADSALTRLSAQQAYFSGFDRDADGRVDVEEYVAYLSAGFDVLDRNGNGRIDDDELPAGTRSSRTREREAHRRAVRAAFARLDSDRNGWLDLRELTAPPR